MGAGRINCSKCSSRQRRRLADRLQACFGLFLAGHLGASWKLAAVYRGRWTGARRTSSCGRAEEPPEEKERRAKTSNQFVCARAKCGPTKEQHERHKLAPSSRRICRRFANVFPPPPSPLLPVRRPFRPARPLIMIMAPIELTAAKTIISTQRSLRGRLQGEHTATFTSLAAHLMNWHYFNPRQRCPHAARAARRLPISSGSTRP